MTKKEKKMSKNDKKCPKRQEMAKNDKEWRK